MASLDEIYHPPVLAEFITRVIQIAAPKKEFARGSGGSGGSSSGGDGGGSPDGGDGGGSPDGGDGGGSPDGGSPDGGSPDGGSPDGGSPDGGSPDGGTPDGGTPDGGTPDGGTPDGGTPDGGTPDSGIKTSSDGSRQGKNDGTPESRASDAKKRADEAKSSDNMKAFAALGIGLTVATALIATALANFLASDGAKIKFKRIVTEKDTPGFVPSFFSSTPTKVGVTWEVQSVGHPGGIPGNVRILKTDEIEWHDSTVGALDGTSPSPTKIKGEREFAVESGLPDSSSIDISDTGYGIIHTSFDDQLDATVKDAASGLGDLAANLFEGFTGLGMGTIIFIILIVVLLFVVGPIIFDMLKSSKSTNN
jgi:hypothetical protein